MERVRCTQCRNPIKPHQTAAGPDGTFHEDCFVVARREQAASAVETQLEYQRLIAEQGLVGLLSPYVCVFPAEQTGFAVKPAQPAGTDDPAPSDPEEPVARSEEIPVQRTSEPNFVMVGLRS